MVLGVVQREAHSRPRRQSSSSVNCSRSGEKTVGSTTQPSRITVSRVARIDFRRRPRTDATPRPRGRCRRAPVLYTVAVARLSGPETREGETPPWARLPRELKTQTSVPARFLRSRRLPATGEGRASLLRSWRQGRNFSDRLHQFGATVGGAKSCEARRFRPF